MTSTLYKRKYQVSVTFEDFKLNEKIHNAYGAARRIRVSNKTIFGKYINRLIETGGCKCTQPNECLICLVERGGTCNCNQSDCIICNYTNYRQSLIMVIIVDDVINNVNKESIKDGDDIVYEYGWYIEGKRYTETDYNMYWKRRDELKQALYDFIPSMNWDIAELITSFNFY